MRTVKKILRAGQRVVSFFGFDPRLFLSNVRGVPAFVADLRRYSSLNPPSQFRLTLRDLYPILNQKYAGAGSVDGHYFNQDIWAARKIFERRPPGHVDIGSRIDGFVAHLLSFMAVTLVDIRPIESPVRGLTFIQDDATELATFPDHSIDSLSSLHAAEHFGLGRYSDEVDPSACFYFMKSLQRVLRPGGRLYFSVPVGRERVDFNAHRVFAIETVVRAFSELTLVSFSFFGDDGRLLEDIQIAEACPGEYSCGMFEFTKPTLNPS